MNKELKIIVGLFVGAFIFLVWAQVQGFKLFKDETGTKWGASGYPYGKVHHK